MARNIQLQYENVQMEKSLPVNIFLRSSNAESEGCEFHWHEELEFYYIQSGAVSLLTGGQQTWLYPGDVGFVNWCQPHRGNGFLNETQHYIIQISTGFLERETLSLAGHTDNVSLLSLFSTNNRAFPVVLRQNAALSGLFDILIRETEEKQPGYELEVRAAVLRILTLLLRECAGDSTAMQQRDSASMEHLKRILLFLSGHCTEPETVTLSALSHRFGLSVPYLCRIFKRHTNLTLTSYVNELRCFRAAALIQDGVPLGDAAMQCGFHDNNYFSRMFKKVMGCSPSAYKQQRGRV